MRANETQQIIRGAAVAALLIIPTLAHAAPHSDMDGASAQIAAARAGAAQARAQVAQARAEAASAAAQARAEALAATAQARAMAQIGPHVVMVAETGGWVNGAVKTYPVRAVKVDDLVGSLVVTAKPDGPITMQLSGIKSRVDGIQVSSDGGTLHIEGTHINSVWDWRNWFNFSVHDESEPQNLIVKLSVPKGTDINIDGLVGDAAIGDTMGPLRLEAAATNAKIGHVGKAKLSFAGSGKIDIAEVAGPLDLDIAGSGKVHVGKSGHVRADIAGAGDASFDTIDGGLKLDIAGSGDVAAGSVNGPVKIGIAGSGSVKIANGQAKPFKVSIMGSGNIDFGGNAVDPDLSALGSGTVRLKSYSGHLSSSGSVSVKVNGKSVSVGSDDDDDDND